MKYEFKETLALPLSKYPERVVISWVTNIPESLLSQWEFTIERCYASDGLGHEQEKDMYGNVIGNPDLYFKDKNFKAISKPINGLEKHEYVDMAVEFGSLITNAFYKIKAVHIKTDDVFYSKDFEVIEEDLDLMGLYIVDENNFLLQDSTGVPSLVYKRKKTGVPCSCIDPIQKKSTKSNCKQCYGTGKVGGYYEPVDCWIDFLPDPKQTVVQDWGRTYPSNTTCFLTNFPDVDPRDLILNLRTAQMWLVESVKEEKERGTLILQWLSVSELKPESAEYSIRPDDEYVRLKIDEYHKRRKRRGF